MKILTFILFGAFALGVRADLASDELLAVFQTRLERDEPIDDLCDSLDGRDTRTLADLIADLDKAWPGVRDRYLRALEAAAKAAPGSALNEHRRRVAELRADFMSIRGMDEAAMKPLLRSRSMPAMEELAKLLTPGLEEIAGRLPPTATALRQAAENLARFRDAALDAALSSTPSDSRQQLFAAGQRIATAAADLPRDGLRVLEKNREIAEKARVPDDEARGIEQANLWRLRVGLNALELDPKLCEASRDHSKDMAEKGFFDHDSPVPGKRTPWDRARNFGTSASGENIYAGSPDPGSANRGWFFSPGHHKNLFGAGHARIGLGRHGGHWTQMFGR